MNEKPTVILDVPAGAAALATELARREREMLAAGPTILPAVESVARPRVSMLDVTSAVVAGLATTDMTPEQAAGAAGEKMETAGLNRKQRRRRGYIKRREARKEKTKTKGKRK